jgi:hypothetical protein
MCAKSGGWPEESTLIAVLPYLSMIEMLSLPNIKTGLTTPPPLVQSLYAVRSFSPWCSLEHGPKNSGFPGRSFHTKMAEYMAIALK